MTDKTKPRTTVAQDVAALRAVVDGKHAQNESPAEVLADTMKLLDLGLSTQVGSRVTFHATRVKDMRDRLERSLAAGKVEPTAWRIHWSESEFGQPELTDDAERVAKVAALDTPPRIVPLYTAPPADPAKASEPDLHAHLLDMLGVKTHEEAGAEIGQLHGIAYGKASVRIDFPGIGHAGPFAVVNGEATLPAATMSDLAHHFRMGYVAKASGSAPEVTEQVIERVAIAIARRDIAPWFDGPAEEAWPHARESTRDEYRVMARNAIDEFNAALQEGKSHG